jgi:hypothetical protein
VAETAVASVAMGDAEDELTSTPMEVAHVANEGFFATETCRDSGAA